MPNEVIGGQATLLETTMLPAGLLRKVSDDSHPPLQSLTWRKDMQGFLTKTLHVPNGEWLSEKERPSTHAEDTTCRAGPAGEERRGKCCPRPRIRRSSW